MVVQKNLSITRKIMFFINFLIILFMSSIIYYTTELICRYDVARSFLEKIKYVPTVPWKVPVISVLLLGVFGISMFLREKVFTKNKLILYSLSVLDIILSILIIYGLNMGYKGILFLAIMNTLIYIEDKKDRTLFIICAILSYILLDYDILSAKINIFSVNDYMTYYTANQRVYMFSIRNILTSLNLMVFIIFMVLILQSKIDENRKIRELYSKLYQTAEELKRANSQLEEYSKKSQEMAKIKERNRVAREIHDTIGHTLTGISTGLEACVTLMDINIERAKTQLIKISELSRKGLLDVRRSVNELRPDSLERASLIVAVEKLCEDMNACTNTRVYLSVEGEVPKLSSDEEQIIYRIVQEGITNAVRHGKAKNVHIGIGYGEGALYLKIEDDGKGCQEVKEGFGLKHIKERVEMLRGKVTFTSGGVNGFKIMGHIPIRGIKDDTCIDS